MTRRALVAVAVGLAALVVPATGFAKGASEATITGPGLGATGITLAGEGQSGGEKLMQIAEEAGFFPAIFVTTPNPMQTARPAGTLGPRYTIVYQMPGPNNELDELRQDVYPYASPSPVSYTAPGQRFWTTEKTVGGWYVASASLKDHLVDVGLPTSDPTAGGDDGFEAPWVVVVGVAAVVGLGLAAVLAVRAWRREGPAPA